MKRLDYLRNKDRVAGLDKEEKYELERGEKYVSWHLFGDGWDEWYNTRKEAEQAYREAVQEADGNINIRLYKEISFENEQEVEEEYIKGRGYFPW